MNHIDTILVGGRQASLLQAITGSKRVFLISYLKDPCMALPAVGLVYLSSRPGACCESSSV